MAAAGTRSPDECATGVGIHTRRCFSMSATQWRAFHSLVWKGPAPNSPISTNAVVLPATMPPFTSTAVQAAAWGNPPTPRVRSGRQEGRRHLLHWPTCASRHRLSRKVFRSNAVPFDASIRRRSSRNHVPSDCSPTLNSRATSAQCWVDFEACLRRPDAHACSGVFDLPRCDGR
jgi:hypothetical protein